MRHPSRLFHHLRGSIDVLDPLFANTIAESRGMTVFDSFGIGHSQGEVLDTAEKMGEIAASFIKALKLDKVNILGFSLGGMVARHISIVYPELLNRLILAGTQPSGHDPVVLAGRSVIRDAVSVDIVTADDMVPIFFSPSEASTASGYAWFKRLDESNVEGEEKKGFLRVKGVLAQAAALSNWTSSNIWFDRLGEIKVPVLVTNGKHGRPTPTPNSFPLQQNWHDAQLHLCPDSGHGHLFQYSENFAKQLELLFQADLLMYIW
ncbi:hypothetical protein ACJ41O_009007 [Fusarium nematophilum]